MVPPTDGDFAWTSRHGDDNRVQWISPARNGKFDLMWSMASISQFCPAISGCCSSRNRNFALDFNSRNGSWHGTSQKVCLDHLFKNLTWRFRPYIRSMIGLCQGICTPKKHGFRWYDRPKWPVIVCSGWHCRFTLWQSNLAVRNSPLLDELHISLFDYPRATSNKPGQQQLCGRIPQKIVWIWSANMDTRCT